MGFLNILDLFANDQVRLPTAALKMMCGRFMFGPQLIEHTIDLAFAVEQPSPLQVIRRPLPPLSSSSRSSPPVQIPTEIVIAILEAAYDPHDYLSNVSFLKSCSLVNRLWSLIAQKLLFRAVTLRSQPAYRSFMSAVNPLSAKGRILGNAVESLRVVLDRNQPKRLRPQSFARAVTMCPHLSAISISLFGVDKSTSFGVVETNTASPSVAFDRHTLDLLRSGPQISALELYNWSTNTSVLEELLSTYPSVTSLSLGGTPPTSSLTPCRAELSELRLNFQTPVPLGVVQALLHASTDSLRKVDLTREESSSVPLLNHLVSTHGHSLESVSLPSCGAHDQALAIISLKDLKEFIVESPWASPMVYRSLPKGARHIALGVDMSTALQPVINVVKQMDVLERVTVMLWEGGEKHPLFPSLQIACAYRGVELDVTRDLKRFRSYTHGSDLVTRF